MVTRASSFVQSPLTSSSCSLLLLLQTKLSFLLIIIFPICWIHFKGDDGSKMYQEGLPWCWWHSVWGNAFSHTLHKIRGSSVRPASLPPHFKRRILFPGSERAILTPGVHVDEWTFFSPLIPWKGDWRHTHTSHTFILPFSRSWFCQYYIALVWSILRVILREGEVNETRAVINFFIMGLHLLHCFLGSDAGGKAPSLFLSHLPDSFYNFSSFSHQKILYSCLPHFFPHLLSVPVLFSCILSLLSIELDERSDQRLWMYKSSLFHTESNVCRRK